MDKPRVYIETTIPSFYHGTRPEPEHLARREWTRRWWAGARGRYELVTSFAVIQELSAGPAGLSDRCYDLIRDLPAFDLTPAITEIVQVYIRNKLMPADPGGDALHLALASQHRCDFLLTWNCSHLANVNKVRHVCKINESLGLFVPTLITPLALLGADDAET